MASRRSWFRKLGWALGVSLAVMALWWVIQPDGPRGLALRIFGPPQVEMVEDHAPEGEARVDHGLFDELLKTYVDADGLVDYAGLQGQLQQLDSYLELVDKVNFDSLSRDEKLALLINAYNAFTLKLILDHYPLASIRDIPSSRRWDAVRWNIGGQLYSLNQIEHEQIRPRFREPRIHFALVCAAVGCPPLRQEAYSGDDLERQLEDQTQRVHDSERWLRYEVDDGRLYLTSLYEWYRDDFDQVAGSVVDFAARYREDLEGNLTSGQRPEVKFLSYDWSLNRQPG